MGATAAATQDTPQNRTPAGRFAPGKSGNPGGRPKGLAARIREVAPADKLAEFYLAVFEGNARKLGKGHKPTLRDRIEAGQWLADRGYGKAASHAPVEGEDPLELSALDEQISEMVDELAARREAPGRGTASDGDLEAATG